MNLEFKILNKEFEFLNKNLNSEKWKRENFLPKTPADEIIKFVKTDVEGRLVEGFRVIAQGFRILIHDTEEDYKESQDIIYKDIAAARRAIRV